MLKRHEGQLWERLDQLYANGTTFISWGELYHWYKLQRIAKTPWRDIQARYAYVTHDFRSAYLLNSYPRLAATIKL